ncbi:MAG: LPS export ABC transporter periplasmic protein LptC [Alphaproteobacteria bacterium]
MTYSKFIKTIKFIFLAISILMLVLIIINNRQNQIKIVGEKFSYTEKIDGSINQVLVKPIFMGLNKKEQPFKVTASKATRFKEESNTFYLENPVGEILIDNDKYFLSGNSGIYDKNIQELKINGDVKFNNNLDLKFSTTEVLFDFKDQILFGEKAVSGYRNNSKIDSQGIKILNKENKIIFTGKTKLLLKNEN